MTPPTQNRRVVRLRCNYQVSCAMLGKRFHAQVVDMSLEGLRLEVAGRVEPKQLLALRYEGPAGCYDFDTVQARVVWSRSAPERGVTELGVTYLHPPAYLERSWIRHLLRVFDLDKMTPVDRRRDIRLAAAFEATIVDEGETATVRNVGLGGVLIESRRELEVGALLKVALSTPEGPIVCDGRVVRVQRQGREQRWQVGVRFTAAPPAYLQEIQRALRAVNG